MVQTGLHTCGVVVAEAPCAKTKNNTIPKSKAPDFFMLLSYHRFLRTSANYCTLEELQRYASVVEWSITTGCKPVAFGLRRFESSPAHKRKIKGVAFYFTSARDIAGTLIPRVLLPFLTSKVNSFLGETSTVMVPPWSTPRLTMSEATLVRILSCISRRRGRAP